MFKEALNVVTQISTPLMLGGLVAFLLFGVIWMFVGKVPNLSQGHGFKVVIFTIKCFFWLALVAIVLGFVGYVVSKKSENVTNIFGDTNAENREKQAEMTGVITSNERDELPGVIFMGPVPMHMSNPSGVIFTDHDDPLIWITNSNGHLLVSAEIRNETGDLIAELRNNEWQLNKDLIFDRNYTNNAVEVRDRRGKIVLQVVDFGYALHFEGLFRCKSGAIFSVGEVGFGVLKEVNITPIFEYPSKLHFGSCPGYQQLQKKDSPVDSRSIVNFAGPLDVGRAMERHQ